MVIIPEPGWHRNLRRQRTRSRTTLRAFNSGAHIPREQVLGAIQVLSPHHSRSTLPRQAWRRLQQQTSDTMAAQSQAQPWTCGCGRLNKAKVDHCAKCGAAWWDVYITPEQSMPWKREDTRPAGWEWQVFHQRPRTPRRKSPRRRPAQAVSAAASAPTASTMIGHFPTPPPLPAMASSKDTSVDGSSGSQELKLLEALLPHVKDTDNLPSHLKEQIQELSAKNTKLEAKNLHATVAARTRAKQSLNRLVLEREVFERTWLDYIEQVSTLLAAQMKEREETLNKFEESRKHWELQLQEASRDLRVDDGVINLEEEDTMADDSQATSTEATMASRGALIQARQEQLTLQLQGLTQALSAGREKEKSKVIDKASAKAEPQGTDHLPPQ